MSIALCLLSSAMKSGEPVALVLRVTPTITYTTPIVASPSPAS
jgi:hypothetical protein